MSNRISASTGRTLHNLPYEIIIEDNAERCLRAARTGGPDGWATRPEKDVLDTIALIHQSSPQLDGEVTVAVKSKPVEFVYFFQATEDQWVLHVDLKATS